MKTTKQTEPTLAERIAARAALSTTVRHAQNISRRRSPRIASI
jgi:hypothetical protein